MISMDMRRGAGCRRHSLLGLMWEERGVHSPGPPDGMFPQPLLDLSHIATWERANGKHFKRTKTSKVKDWTNFHI